VLVCLAPLACASPPPLGSETPLWLAPRPPDDPAALRLEPARLVLALGETATLSLQGASSPRARCSSDRGAVSLHPDGTLPVASLSAPGVIDFSCQVGALRAQAQVTFSAARVLPLRDPYAGGVVLFKLRRAPDPPESPIGRQTLGFRSLDALLRRLDAHAFPAFPFDRSRTLDRVGLGRWVAIELPPGVNYYQALAWLRADRHVLPQSYWPEDGDYLRVDATEGWPAALVEPRPGPGARPPRGPQLTPVAVGGTRAAGKVGWELEAIGAPQAWKRGRGDGAGVAVIDTGVDLNHVSISGNLREKREETPTFDADGNGIPGDRVGVSLAHLAIAHGAGPPRLALGLLSNVSDWSGSDARPLPRRWGHGTALAALAAGTGDADGRLGVAPHAWILPVDIQENRRVTRSRWLDEDPRMRTSPGPPAAEPPLRSPLWARAAGVAYAVREGVRVLTCAWPPLEPTWILHDVLLYAEDNCALAVCASRGRPSSSAGHPARWRAHGAQGRSSHGELYDAWTGEVRPGFFKRPLRSLLLADGFDAPPSSRVGNEADLRVRLRSPSQDRAIRSAASDPRNDSTPLLDRRSTAFARPGAAAGLVAGAALLLSARRPDLEPLALRNALLDGARSVQGEPLLWIPGALEAAERRPRGRCVQVEEEEHAQKPWWERVRVRATMRQPGVESAEPAPEVRWP